jgi:tight adherence protein C
VVRVTGLASWAVFCGLALGVGLWLIVSLAPRLRRPSLMGRVAPYVVDLSADARELLDRRTADPLPVLNLIVAPLTQFIRKRLGSVWGGNELTRRRLRQAGSRYSVDEYRAQQMIWAAGGAVVAVGAAVAIGVTRSVPIAANGALVIVAAIAGFAARDYVLQRAAGARMARMGKELPTVLEFLTLSLSAGEGILDAIRRIARISRGELAAELAGVVANVGSGLPLSDSLSELSTQLQLPSLTRAVDQITGALERGTPLAEVLRAQAQDVRDESKRSLLELSGKKEIAMLVPLVFLILPLTIVIAIFPGILELRLDL